MNTHLMKYLSKHLLLSTVSSSQDKIISDQGSTTKPHVIYKQSNNPWPLMFFSFKPSYNSVFSWIMTIIFNTTNVLRLNIMKNNAIEKSILPSKFLGAPSYGFGIVAFFKILVKDDDPLYFSILGLYLCWKYYIDRRKGKGH